MGEWWTMELSVRMTYRLTVSTIGAQLRGLAQMTPAPSMVSQPMTKFVCTFGSIPILARGMVGFFIGG